MVSANNSDCPGVTNPRYVNGRTCYDSSMFDHLTPQNRKNMVQKFAPLALYMQEVTGFPASVLIGNIAKEQGWVTTAPGNNFYGIKCISRNGNESFTLRNGLSLTVNYDGCGSFQRYASDRDSMISYLYLLLYSTSSVAVNSYSSIRDEIPATFPPPGNRDNIVNAIGESPYCAAGCNCSGISGGYSGCMASHIRRSCTADLDNMILCDYDYPELEGLSPLHNNISPSTDPNGGTATPLTYQGTPSGSSNGTEIGQ